MLHTSSRDSLHLCHGRREVVKELVVYKLITVLIPSVVSELFTFLHVDFFVSIIVLVSFDSSIYMKSLSLYILLYRKYFVLVCQSLLLVNTFSPYIQNRYFYILTYLIFRLICVYFYLYHLTDQFQRVLRHVFLSRDLSYFSFNFTVVLILSLLGNKMISSRFSSLTSYTPPSL